MIIDWPAVASFVAWLCLACGGVFAGEVPADVPTCVETSTLLEPRVTHDFATEGVHLAARRPTEAGRQLGVGLWRASDGELVHEPWVVGATAAFGRAVAMTSDLLVVGDRWYDGPGAVFVFDVATGALVATLRPSGDVETENFGHAVAIDGARVLVGASGSAGSAAVDGYVELFDLGDVTAPRRVARLSGFAGFGVDVALSATHAVVRQLLVTFGGTIESFSLYELDAPGGARLVELFVVETAGFAGFGASFALSEDRLFVGADTHAGTGVVVVYDVSDGELVDVIEPPDGGGLFGHDLDVDRGRVVVGAYGHVGTGAAYVYDEATLALERKLVAGDAEPGDEFGHGVTVANGVALVSAPDDDTEVGRDAGSVRAFDLTGAGSWSDLGGANGAATLTASGTLAAGCEVALHVEAAPPVSPTLVVLGLSTTPTPVAGATLFPSVDAVLVGPPTDRAGAARLAGAVPADVPAALYAQIWIVPGVLTNAVAIESP